MKSRSSTGIVRNDSSLSSHYEIHGRPTPFRLHAAGTHSATAVFPPTHYDPRCTFFHHTPFVYSVVGTARVPRFSFMQAYRCMLGRSCLRSLVVVRATCRFALLQEKWRLQTDKEIAHAHNKSAPRARIVFFFLLPLFFFFGHNQND